MNRDVSFNLVAAVAVERHASNIRGKVLDVGCGAKPYKRLFYDPIEKKYGAGVEMWAGLDIRSVGDIKADVQEMPIVRDEFYDTVLCVDVLSYVFDPHAAFLEMARVLKPGGRLIAIEPNCRHDDQRAFWGFRTRALGALAQNADLEVLDLEASGKLWAGEYENFRGQTKYGHPLPTEVSGFAESLDEDYPNCTVLVAQKK